MLRPATLLLALTALVTTCTAQITVHQTYSDWKTHKPGPTYAVLGVCGHAMGKPFVDLMPEGGRKWVREREIWGLTSGEELYRLDNDDGKMHRLVRLVESGRICMWQLRGSENVKEENPTLFDFAFFLTEGINGEIIAMPHGIISWSGLSIAKYKKFIKTGKESKYRVLCECLEKDHEARTAYDCIRQYNADHPLPAE